MGGILRLERTGPNSRSEESSLNPENGARVVSGGHRCSAVWMVLDNVALTNFIYLVEIPGPLPWEKLGRQLA